MAHFSIYIPFARGASNDHLRNVGLDPLCKHGGAQWTELVGQGPDGNMGSIVTWCPANHPEHDPLLGYYPDRQQWTPAEVDEGRGLKAGRFWLGIEPARPPTAADLRYRQVLLGVHIEMADGSVYLIPEVNQLPHKVRLRNGKWLREIADEYRSLADRGKKLLEVLMNAVSTAEQQQLSDPFSLSITDGGAFVCDLLMVNYRLTPEIIDHLGLLNDRTMAAVIWASVGLEKLREQNKPKGPETITIPVTLEQSPITKAGSRHVEK